MLHINQGMKVVLSCVEWMVCALERASGAHSVAQIDGRLELPAPEIQHVRCVLSRGVWMHTSHAAMCDVDKMAVGTTVVSV